MSELTLSARRQLFEELAFLLEHMPARIPHHLQTPLGKKLVPHLQRGLSLPEAYRCIGGDALTVGLLLASQNDLGNVIPEIARYYAGLEEIFQTVRKQMAYPAITLLVAILVVGGFFVFVYPLLQVLLPQDGAFNFWPLLGGGLVVVFVGCSKKVRQLFLDWTHIPALLRKMQIILLVQLAPDSTTLVSMLQRYAPDGSLASVCFQLHKGIRLSQILRNLSFSDTELLLVHQAENSGDKLFYQKLLEVLRKALEARIQLLTQLIEPVVTLLTGGLVTGCVCLMLWPVLQLQQGMLI